jgi:hypothetical protein
LVATFWNLHPRFWAFFWPCWVVLAYGKTFTGFYKSWLTSSSSTLVQHECISTRAIMTKWKYYLAYQFLSVIVSSLKLKESMKNWWTYWTHLLWETLAWWPCSNLQAHFQEASSFSVMAPHLFYITHKTLVWVL